MVQATLAFADAKINDAGHLLFLIKLAHASGAERFQDKETTWLEKTLFARGASLL